MLKLELRPEQPTRIGQGRLYLMGWTGQLVNIHIAIQRIEDKCYLADNGQWQKRQAILKLPELKKTENGEYWLSLDKHYIIPLLSNPLAEYRLALSDGCHTESSHLTIARELRSMLSENNSRQHSTATHININHSKSVSSSNLSAWQDNMENSAIQEQNSFSSMIRKKNTLMMLWNLFLLFIIMGSIIGSIILWMIPKESRSFYDKLSISTPSILPSACNIEAMNALKELDFVRFCLKDATDSKVILQVIELAKREKYCGIAQRLYAYKAQSGDTIIALAYAKEYENSEPKQCFTVDIDTARYWYQHILTYDTENTEAKARLAALSE